MGVEETAITKFIKKGLKNTHKNKQLNENVVSDYNMKYKEYDNGKIVEFELWNMNHYLGYANYVSDAAGWSCGCLAGSSNEGKENRTGVSSKSEAVRWIITNCPTENY